MQNRFRRLIRLLRVPAIVVVSCLATFLVVRALDSLRGNPLQAWHVCVPGELATKQLQDATWADYIEAEERVFREVRVMMDEKVPPDQQLPYNRYHAGSPVDPGRFATDWNRSFVLEPDGRPLGAVVLLHGLTDSPYSLRHIAAAYRDHGFVAVGIRLPGHGTVPGALTGIDWQTWSAATGLAVREALRLAGEGAPLHLVGYSNGGALALKHALDAVEEPGLQMPERLVLLSPMVGITELARFAGIAGWPAVLPAFAKASWISILPEFNPYKYNSFPVNAARQSSLLTRSLQPRLAAYARQGRFEKFPPVLTFQSAMDFTTSTRAVISALYDQLPANGSELVLYDINRSAALDPLVRPGAAAVLDRLLPPAPRRYAVSILTNSAPDTRRVEERRTPAGETTAIVTPLDLEFPVGVFSLSHVAPPFPLDDPLYGMFPEAPPEFGISLGALAPRGERGTLIVRLDDLIRMYCNPFFPHMLERIGEGIHSADPPR